MMYGGSFGRTEGGQDYWEAHGRDAVRMARLCADMAKARGDWDRMMLWERRWAAHCADPFKPLRCNLPPGMVKYERHSRGIFGPPAATMFDEQRLSNVQPKGRR